MERPKFGDFAPLPEIRRDQEKACCQGGEATDETAEKKPSGGSCCSGGSDEKSETASCCGGSKGGVDWILWGSGAVALLALLVQWFWVPFVGAVPWVGGFFHHLTELLVKMSWGLVAGILAVGLLSWVPRSWVARVLGHDRGWRGLLRATLAGLLLDLCNHGILMIAAQLYKKGASLGQTVAFLIASPWNSLSMTLILMALIGLKWTLAFIGLSMVIALLTGFGLERLVRSGRLPENPNAFAADEAEAPGWEEVKTRFGEYRQQHPQWLRRLFLDALSESRMILRWILFGAVLAALIQAYVPTEALGTWFGPSLLGLLLTLGVTTVIEVCSEGSSPIAADLLGRAGAPGNAFTFLMAGAATDYTELMVMREATKTWKCALAIPLLAVPQTLLIGYLLNSWS